ncbi:HNH endonuclease [Anabaena minutissima FACHB-250]|nr:HNH endonuclease [Anabaena minutissima FACHB-250]
METIIFLCNSTINKELPKSLKSEISLGNYCKFAWSCGNSKFIKVGDRAYLQKTGSVGNESNGFIAAGHVIAAPENKQLNRLKKYSVLSEAYFLDDAGCFYVYIQIDSVVDLDFPLEQKYLKTLPQFQGANFNFGGGGCRFNSKAASFLDSEWEKHSLIQQRQKRGRRLVDVFFEQGEACKQNKEYHAAIEKFKLSLKVDPKYAKAIDQIKSCESILNRLNQVELKPPIVTPPLPDETKLISAREELDKEKFFTFKNDVEACKKITVSIARRQGQQKFRQSLLDAYSSKCAITNFDAEVALEAAHIIPYIETENNSPSNGLLLRADLHTLFDLNIITIDPETLKVYIHPILQKTEYRTLEGKELRVPQDEMCRPNKQFLKQRFNQCEW